MELRKKQRAVVDALEDVKGRDIVVLDTARLPTMFERVIIASGDSTRQVRALADRVAERIRALGGRVYGLEGERSSEWVLVDLGDIVVHLMVPAVRGFYDLEEIWSGKTVHVKTGKTAPAAKKKPVAKKTVTAKRTPATRTPAKRPAAKRVAAKRAVKKKR
ncbi:MAG: ribosome silencing factor [Proteobacteria bacterium]|nr:ribosome silencing factor [Pseudomonadota bacterium]